MTPDESAFDAADQRRVINAPGPHMDLAALRVNWGSGVWHAGAAVLITLVLSDYRLGRAVSSVPISQIPQLLTVSIAYLLTVLLAGTNARPLTTLVTIRVTAYTAISFGVAFLLLSRRVDLTASRSLFLIGGVLTISLVLIAFALKHRSASLLLPWACVAALTAWQHASPAPAPSRHMRRAFTTELTRVSMTYSGLISPDLPDGGGLTAWHDGFLLATGGGAFYRLRLTPNDSVIADSLPIRVPMERTEYLADFKGKTALRLRVTGILLDTTVSPAIVYVAYQHWNHSGGCFTLRVSGTPVSLPDERGVATTAPWKLLFESQPCIVPNPPYDDYETGGRLARNTDGRILFTLGDFGYSGAGKEAISQLPNSDYGKVILLDTDGVRTPFTSGHRNPEGLLVDRSGRIWETEHGPQGGDELNLLVRGADYGWPLVTYGTEYGQLTWPLAHGARNHGKFTEPVYAFVPSIGISNLIELGPREFPAWQNDLLVSSLGRETLFRIRLNGDRVVYAEPILVQRRIRALAQGTDGRIVLWTDGGDLVVLSAGQKKADVLTLRCTGCHSVTGDAGPTAAPKLFGIVGRPVASDSGFAYSEAIQKLGGEWTVARLDSFLTAPGLYAPGNNMRISGITDSVERRAIIEGLEHLH